MNKLGEILSGLFGGILGVIGMFSFPLSIYATFKDFKADEMMWATLDICTIITGVVRGIMYLFGWL